MWPFKPRVIDDDTVAWQLDVAEWFIRTIGPGQPISATTLVVPGRDHFVTDGEKGHAFAKRVFNQVRAYAGVDPARIISLVPQPARGADVLNDAPAVGGAMSGLVTEKALPLGTFSVNDDDFAEVSYDPVLVRDPENLISVFAHELVHYLAPPGIPLPVPEEEYELLTDACVAFLGFGVFLSNTRLERYLEDGWVKWRGGGYLPVNDRVFATALFLAIKNDDDDRRLARQFLRPYLRRTFDRAFAQLKRFQPDIDRLRALDRANTGRTEATDD